MLFHPVGTFDMVRQTNVKKNVFSLTTLVVQKKSKQSWPLYTTMLCIRKMEVAYVSDAANSGMALLIRSQRGRYVGCGRKYPWTGKVLPSTGSNRAVMVLGEDALLLNHGVLDTCIPGNKYQVIFRFEQQFCLPSDKVQYDFRQRLRYF